MSRGLHARLERITKVIISGSRHGRPNQELTEAIAHAGFEITEVVHGGASGVDAQADQLARALDIPVTIFRPDWKNLGKAAGPMRNRRIAGYADALIALDGGDGTADMIRAARRAKLPVYVHPPGLTAEEDALVDAAVERMVADRGGR